MNITIIIFLILIIVIYTRPVNISNFTKSSLGKFIFLMALIYTALNYKAACFLLAILFITLLDLDSINEYFDTQEVIKNNKLQINTKKDFIQKHCKKKVVNGKEQWNFVNYQGDKEMILLPNDISDTKIISEDGSTSYKVEFKDKICNPCSPNCKYSVTESIEKIVTEEKLRPKKSSIMIN